MALSLELDVIRQSVEHACSSLQGNGRREAEATILAFRRSPHVLQAGQHILETSQSADACFQAAAAMQEAALHQWPHLSSQDRNHLLRYCLNFAVARATAEPFVLRKVIALTAVLLKRSWLDSSSADRDAFLTHLNKVAQGELGGSPMAQRSAITLLEAVVVEFSASATPMLLPAEFHDRCRDSLEAHYLLPIYGVAQEAAVAAAGQALQGGQQPADICTAALHVILQLLVWECSSSTLRGRGQRGGSANKAGPVLRDVLATPSKMAWVLELYHRLRTAGVASGSPQWMDSPLASITRQVLVQLCSGSAYLKDVGGDHLAYAQQMLAGIQSWLTPPSTVVGAVAAGGPNSELLDGCRALAALASNTPPAVFDAALAGSQEGGAVGLLTAVSCASIAHGGSALADTEVEEAFEVLLGAWGALVEPDLKQGKVQGAPPPASITYGAATVMEHYVQAELAAAAASAHDEDDETEHLHAAEAARDERLSSVAALARAAPHQTLPMLTRLMNERHQWLVQSVRERKDPTAIMEELHSLLLLAGHCIADAGEGETPMIPEALAGALGHITELDIVSLSRAGIDLACLALSEEARATILSPRLMEAIIWFLARWADTYLMPGRNAPPWNFTDLARRGQHLDTANELLQGTGAGGERGLAEAFGEQEEGEAALQAVLAVAFTALTVWPGEIQLQGLVCSKLLPVLTRRRKLCGHVIALEPWQQLEKAFGEGQALLAALPAPLHRALAEVLCAAAASDTVHCTARINALMHHSFVEVVALSERPDLQSIAQRPDVMRQVSCMLERLRGAARACKARSQKVVLQLGFALREALLKLLQAYTHQPQVVYLVLKFWVEWVESEIAYLDGSESEQLLDFCMRLLKVYSDNNCGKVSLQASWSLASEARSEKYKDLRALLQLLTNISSKDLVDFYHAAEGERRVDVSKVLYLGLHIVLPLITDELLQYPKLCRQYFQLLEHLLSVYPERMAELPPEMFGPLIQTLQFGLHHQDSQVVALCLSALGALASWHGQVASKGQPGLGPHALARHGPDGALQEGVLAHFLRLLLQMLLLGKLSADVVPEPAADALLPLLLCESQMYQRLAQELLAAQPAEAQQQLVAALSSLLMFNQAPMTLDRYNRRQFRTNLEEFLPLVRSMLLKK